MTLLEIQNPDLARIVEVIRDRLDELGLPDRVPFEPPVPPSRPQSCTNCDINTCLPPDSLGGPWGLCTPETFSPMSAQVPLAGDFAPDDRCECLDPCQDADEVDAVTDAIRLSGQAVGEWRDRQRDLNREIEITSLLGTQAGQVIAQNFAAASTEIRVAQEALGQFGNALIEVIGALRQGGGSGEGGGFGGILGDLVGDLFGGGGSDGGFLSDLFGGGDGGGFLSDLFGGGDGGGGFDWLPGFAKGGRPPLGLPSLVGEHGPEIFVPDVAGTILPNGAAPAINVNVINNTSAEVDVQQRGPDLDIVVGDMIDRQMARGRLDGAMRRRYGVTPSTAR